MIGPGDIERFRRWWSGAGSFVVSTHINPDGDAIGSELSLAAFLEAQGKRVRIVNHDPTPVTLEFLTDPRRPIELYDPANHDPVFEAVDAIALVDNSAPDRLGLMEPVLTRLAAKTFCIDHHPMRTAPWAETILDTGSCATTAMIYDLGRGCGWEPGPAAAEAIYVGLATDTGFFRFNSTNPRGHEIAAELLRAGVDSASTYQRIYERNSVPYTLLLGDALSRLALHADGAVASVALTWARLRELGAEDVDPTEITTALLAIDGVRMAILFRELPGGRVKVSLRSKGTLDVRALACGFGGGGHRNASGIVVEGRLDALADEVIRRATAMVERDGGPPCA